MNFKTQILLLRTTEGKLLFKPLGYHKLLLAVFGFFLDGTRGAIIGFIVGSCFDMTFVRKVAPPKHPDMRLNFLMLAAFILQVTGLQIVFSPETLRTRLSHQFGENYVEKRFNFFRELLRQRIQVEAICDQLKTNASLDEKIMLVRFLYEVSSHPQLSFEKLNQTVLYLATRIDLDSKYVKQLSAQYASKSYASSDQTTYYQPKQKQDAYTLFGLTSDCTERQLKKAYHQLAKKYHPDAHPGLDSAEKIKLQEKFRRITEAYEKLKQERGWK